MNKDIVAQFGQARSVRNAKVANAKHANSQLLRRAIDVGKV